MKIWLFGTFVLLWGGAAQAQPAADTYATVGDWEITADSNNRCSMTQVFTGVAADGVEVIGVVYDAKLEGVVLSWASNKPKYPLASGSVDLDVAFMKSSPSKESWSNKRFDSKNSDGTYRLHHALIGRTDTYGMLDDLATNEIVAIFFGPTMITSLPLNATEAVAKLRECATNGDRVP
jgi:hypothetical protein